MLALDPFYEMFPTTRRRSYPWWRYSYGLGANGAFLPGYKLFSHVARADGTGLDGTVTLDTFEEARNAFAQQIQVPDTLYISLFRERADGSRFFIATFSTSSTATIGLPANVIAPETTPRAVPIQDPTASAPTLPTTPKQDTAIPGSGLSKGTKVAVGVGVVAAVAVGLAAVYFARR